MCLLLCDILHMGNITHTVLFGIFTSVILYHLKMHNKTLKGGRYFHDLFGLVGVAEVRRKI